MEETYEADELKDINKKQPANSNVQDDFNASISSDDITLHDKLNNANYQLKAKQNDQFNTTSNNKNKQVPADID